MGIQKQDSDWNAKVGSILHVESSSRIEPSAIQHKSSDMNVHLNETFEVKSYKLYRTYLYFQFLILVCL